MIPSHRWRCLFAEHTTEVPTISPRAPADESRTMEDWVLYHPVYTEEQVRAVRVTHHESNSFADKLAAGLVKTFRKGFDLVTFYRHSSPEAALKAAAKQGKTNLTVQEMRKAGLTMDDRQCMNVSVW